MLTLIAQLMYPLVTR